MTALLRTLSAALVVALPAQAAEVTSFELDNGMEVVVLEDHRAPAVTHMVWYRAGSADEDPGVSGIAHFTEHLLFKSTETLATGELSETVAANGGSDNAFTSFDYTAYFQRIAADRLELVMRMEADRMRNIRFIPEEIDTERLVILEERSQRTDNDPSALFGEQRRAAQYQNHRYGVPIIGWRHEMEELDGDDAQAFYDRFYWPNNAVLVVAGDVEPEAVRALAETYYGVIPANPDLTPRARPTEPPQLGERRITFADERVSQPYVLRTYLAPERNSGDQETAAALVMLSELLGGSSATSVLGQKLQFQAKTALYASAFYSPTSLDATTFGLVVVPAAGVSLEDAEAEMDRALAEFMVEGVDLAQLERIKFQIRASQIYAEDSVGSLARRYGSALTSGLTVEDVEAWPAVLDAVTPDDIMAAAELVFDRNKAVTGWLTRSVATEEVTQ
ncbi:MAG: insulinase family protein [Rhodobacteraceae bacterium]|nr:insulinase family protein [Paracoccaceae bacterium]